MDFCNPCRSQPILDEFQPPMPKYIFESNSPPKLEDIPSLHKSFAQTEQDLFILRQHAIPELESMLHALRRRENALEHNIMLNKGALSPIRRIPPEILAHIFALTLPQPLSQTKVSLNPAEGLTPFTRVCQIWKQAALLMSQVWTNIEVRSDEYYKRPYSNLDQILRNIFSYTGGKAVRLSLSIEGKETRSISLLKTAMHFSAQWRDVTVLVDHPKLFSRLTKLHGRLPQLEQIVFRNPYGILSSRFSLKPLDQALSVAPKLRQVVFDSVQDPGAVVDLALPWLNLTHFPYLPPLFTECAFEHISALLSKLPNLIFFDLTRVLYREQDQEAVSKGELNPITLPHLRSLKFSNAVYTDSRIRFLTSPALEEITNVSNNNYLSISQLVQRSRCSIKRLGFASGESDMHEDGLRTLFLAMPAVTILFLGSPRDAYEQYIAPISSVLSNPQFLPQLEILQAAPLLLAMGGGNQSTLHKLVQMLLDQGKLTGVSFIGPASYDCDPVQFTNNYAVFVAQFKTKLKVSWDSLAKEHGLLAIPVV